MESTKLIKILSVDDEPDMADLLSQRFRKEIRKNLFEFYFAGDGRQALNVLQEQPDIDFLLCDINMPVMDGLTLLSELTKLKRPSLLTVMVTAYGDMDNLRTAMNNGAFDFVNKPINFDDLEKTMDKTILRISQIRTAIQQHDRLTSIESDLEIAKNIQLSLVPRKFPPFPNRNEIDIFASMNAAKTVGGDLYDFFFIDDSRIGFVIGDVSGKGVPAAIFMALSRTIIRTAALKNDSPEKCIAEANNQLYSESIDEMFVTVFYAILDLKTGKLSFANGGHNLPYVIKKSGEIITFPKTGNIVLGIIENIAFKKLEIDLQVGDSVYLFTDGVPEAMNAKDEPYSEERLKKILTENHTSDVRSICKNIEKDIEIFTAGYEQSDDITMLIFKFNKIYENKP